MENDEDHDLDTRILDPIDRWTLTATGVILLTLVILMAWPR